MGDRNQMVLEAYNKRIGDTVRRMRKEQSINQQDFAERMGYSKSHMCALENGRKNFTFESLILLAEQLGCDPAVLVAGGTTGRWNESNAYKILMDDVKDDSYEAICKVIDIAWRKDHPDKDLKEHLQKIQRELREALGE